MPFAARHVPARRARTLAPFTVASPRRPEIALFRRIAAVTLALSAIGAVVGAALGMLALWGLSIAVGNPRAVELIGGAGYFGAILGAVLAPVAAWTLMRHVPLWRAIVETALGTALGVAAGWVAGPRLGRAALWPLGLGLVGFAVAAIRLRLTHRGRERAASASDLPPPP
jgi:hypothetical protein